MLKEKKKSSLPSSNKIHPVRGNLGPLPPLKPQDIGNEKELKRNCSYNTENEGISEVRIGATVREDESMKQKTEMMQDSRGIQKIRPPKTDLVSRGSIRGDVSQSNFDQRKRYSVKGRTYSGFGIDKEFENRIII